jgi:hypothetical protein
MTFPDSFFIMSNNKDITLSKSRLHVMIGLPGGGKNTYIDNVLLKEEPDAVCLSRDDIRVELGYCTVDEKIVGTDNYNQFVKENYEMFVKMMYDLGYFNLTNTETISQVASIEPASIGDGSVSIDELRNEDNDISKQEKDFI